MRKLLLIGLALLILPQALAATIGVSPGNVKFEDVLQGGYAEATVFITSDVDNNLSIDYQISGDVSTWIKPKINGTQFFVQKGKPGRFELVVEPPANVRPGVYTGKINFLTGALGQLEGTVGNLIRAGVDLLITVDITGEERVACTAGGLSFSDGEVGFQHRFTSTVLNTGNVRLSPGNTVRIWNKFQDEIVKELQFTGPEILPTTSRSYSRDFELALAPGQYWADLTVPECGYSQLVTFNVLEEGAVVDKGTLQEIRNKPWVEVGELVEINAIFSNDGNRFVLAKFLGTISLDDKIVDTIETDELRVESRDSVQFSHLFRPREPGRYVVTGRVYYNNKISFEKSSVINVVPKSAEPFTKKLIPYLVYLIIVLIILILLVKIKQARKRRGR
ncbi:hypothetical protein J4475_03900 [Candidatus Woesearchaeota archaeon]|nr:hypothetical protein [Candidatus Woesearchaeota archaeon]